ncbi:MAG: phage tail tube protein [Candidatus Heimdallarchaeota archaeon]
MGKINAKNILIYKDSTALGFQSTGTLNIESEQIDVTTKENDGWGEVLPGTRTWSLDVDGLMDYSSTATDNGGQVLGDAILADEILNVSWETDTIGDITFSGQVYTGSLSLGGANNEGATYTGTLNGVGAVAKGTKT